MKHIITTLRQIGFMTTALMLAMVGTFVHATWSEPTGTPPNNNTDAPVNVGSTAQVKSGSLSVDGLAVIGDQVIDDVSPTIEFSDNTAGAMDWWTHVNSNRFYFLVDRNDDGAWTGDQQWPLYLTAGATDNDDVAVFSNQVRAREYCDRLANFCFTPADVSASAAPSPDTNGSLVFAALMNTVPDGTVINYGDVVDGSSLCPAGISAYDTNDNDKIGLAQGDGTVCDVTLTGQWQALGYTFSFTSAFNLTNISGRKHMTLFQRISD